MITIKDELGLNYLIDYTITINLKKQDYKNVTNSSINDVKKIVASILNEELSIIESGVYKSNVLIKSI